ncbi:Abscission/NoCut checkpoint regulator-like protein [Emericellopsis cladophorae]|uniref:Abscission/NoCut checkpoint regulator-like protein n=1 Tax=Emericellopsis cladophorae TaxID=2686198 RepID=A0A9Q0BG41_9HYPO|nr:Abscission/NoCut checkpoint regulator-like protein [Emericellopsis cladophorae]KAI6784622.1 Abscission/NoCut checkpoint regulator-like protein [Emericellopsis cladophorae]
MPNDVDKSLLDRLQALRGTRAPPESTASQRPEIDLIERKTQPNRDDALAARLKSLRKKADSPAQPAPSISEKQASIKPSLEAEEDEIDFGTDDQTLQDLLKDVDSETSYISPATGPSDAKVRELLEELSRAVPQDDAKHPHPKEDDRAEDSDNSDGETMKKEADSLIARFRDELEVEAKHPPSSPSSPTSPVQETDEPPPSISLPEVPTSGEGAAASPSGASLDDLTTRLSALRTDSIGMPDVPTSTPTKKPKRLVSKTKYTDDDVDAWCTVCLEDATLLCKGCSDGGDPYCRRCWRDMHIGPAAAFDDRDHVAVEFSRKKRERKVALGA